MGKLLVVPVHFVFFGHLFQTVKDVVADGEVFVEVVEVAVLRLDFVAVLEGVVGGEAVECALG